VVEREDWAMSAETRESDMLAARDLAEIEGSNMEGLSDYHTARVIANHMRPEREAAAKLADALSDVLIVADEAVCDTLAQKRARKALAEYKETCK